jgi:hypothetical protein
MSPHCIKFCIMVIITKPKSIRITVGIWTKANTTFPVLVERFYQDLKKNKGIR